MNDIGNPENRRKRERLHLSLPIRVNVRETADAGWEEVTRLIDVTPFGAGFTLARALEQGRLVQLTIPMPRQLRVYDHIEPQYTVWALVRHVRKQAADEAQKVRYSIGTAFVGKYPPEGFLENPAQLYEAFEPDEFGFWRLRQLVTSADGDSHKYVVDLRHKTRHQIPMNVQIEVFDERGIATASEHTVTENISVGGASVFTTFEVERGRFVRLTSDEYNVTIVAVVRSRQVKEDGIARLHLEFIDRQFPLPAVD